jgi:tRNA (guanine37-N1)-methyltransferase
MQIDILTVVPDLLQSPFAHSIMKRAADKGLLQVNIHNLRDYTTYARQQVDDYPFGGGAGMVIMMEPLVNAINALSEKNKYDEVIFLTPDGKTFNQGMANALSLKQKLLLICGHYKGIDQRFREHFVTMEISIGDYVLSGGELPAAILTDAIGRLLPGVLNDETSALSDSFQDNLLAPPVYTRPEVFNGWPIPNVLKSGNHKLIEDWRYNQALERTKKLRPDLLNGKEELG